MKKRTLSLCLALILCLALVPTEAAAKTWATTYSHDQLSKNGKEIYQKLEEQVDKLNKGKSVEIKKTFSKVDTGKDYYSDIPPALITFLADHPEYFWLTLDYTYGYSYQGKNWTFHMECQRFEPWLSGGRSIEADRAAAEAQVDAIAAGARAVGDSRYDQLLYVHDWLTEHNLYNSPAEAAGRENFGSGIPWTAVGALLPDESPVCEGYAKAFLWVCNELGIPCILVSGSANGPHVWNAVQMEDGAWYAVDATWDDPIYTLNGEVQNTPVSGGEHHKYFLAGSQTLSTHTDRGDRPYPTLSVTDYERPQETVPDEEPEETAPADEPTQPQQPEPPAAPVIEPTGILPQDSGTAKAATQTVLVDGREVTFQMYALENSDGGRTNYVKLRDLADILDGTAAQFNVGWDGQVNIERSSPYTTRNGQEGKTPYSGDRDYIRGPVTTNVDGVAIELQVFTLTDDNGGQSNYYQLRHLGQALGFNVCWDGAAGKVIVETDKPYDGTDR